MSTSTTARLLRKILPEVSHAKRFVSTSCSKRSARVVEVEGLDIKRVSFTEQLCAMNGVLFYIARLYVQAK